MHVKKNIFHNALDHLLCIINLLPVQFPSAAQAVTDLTAGHPDVQTTFLLMVPKSQFTQSSSSCPWHNGKWTGASLPWVLLKKTLPHVATAQTSVLYIQIALLPFALVLRMG